MREKICVKEKQMSNKNPVKNKHMRLEDRVEIQECLYHGMSFKAIAKRVGKDATTVSKEIKKHLSIEALDFEQFDRDGKAIAAPVCKKLLGAPYVCNPCDKKRRRCGFQKQFYLARPAQTQYEKLLSEAREGIALNRQEFYDMDAVISEGMSKGQRLYHIMETQDLGVSKSTVYRNLHKGYLSVSKMDFPRIVKFKARKTKPKDYIPRGLKIGRSHKDFLDFIEENSISAWVEMDTVIGRIGGKVILTLHFTFCNFMFGLLLNDKTAAEAASKILTLKSKLTAAGLRFGDLFPLLLTDNGGEFANIAAFENNADGTKESAVYFCDPMQSSQKARIEKNHTILRDIVPKGISFDEFTQDKLNLIFSHVNSVKRKVLGGKSPCELFEFAFGSKLLSVLNIKKIPPQSVIQSPKLLK